MRLAYQIDVSGPVNLFTGIAERAADPARLLKRWGGYFKSKALDRANAQEGWPPLAQSTQQKLRATRTSAITAHGKVRKSSGAAIERAVQRLQRKGQATGADVAEVQRLRAGGHVGSDPTWVGSKAVGRLRKRQARAEAQRAAGKRVTVGGDKRKADKHKPLGRVARQIQWDVQGAKVVTYSKVPWSEVHNLGGTAGHGATEPKRVFLTIDARDQVVLAEIAESHLMGVR